MKDELPNPDNYEVKDVSEHGPYKVIVIHYPGCTNFKGLKCIVAKCSMLDLVKAKWIDPHFDGVKPSSNIEIVARFPPSAEGIRMAKAFADKLQRNKLIDPGPPRGGPGDR